MHKTCERTHAKMGAQVHYSTEQHHLLASQEPGITEIKHPGTADTAHRRAQASLQESERRFAELRESHAALLSEKDQIQREMALAVEQAQAALKVAAGRDRIAAELGEFLRLRPNRKQGAAAGAAGGCGDEPSSISFDDALDFLRSTQ